MRGPQIERRPGLAPTRLAPSRFSWVTGSVLMLLVAALTGPALTWHLLGDASLTGPLPGRLTIGPWAAEPFGPPAGIDRYARAALARSGTLPLGPGEGLTLRAAADASGRPLDGACRYRVGPIAPQARWWTLAAYGPDGRPPAGPEPQGLTSAEAPRPATIEVGAAPAGAPAPPRLPAPRGRFVLVLRLYEPTLGFGPGPLDGLALPAIAREGCP